LKPLMKSLAADGCRRFWTIAGKPEVLTWHSWMRFGVPTLSPIVDTRTYFDYHHSPADTLDQNRARPIFAGQVPRFARHDGVFFWRRRRMLLPQTSRSQKNR